MTGADPSRLEPSSGRTLRDLLFERGVEFPCGGAINKVTIAGESLECLVIGGGSPRGLCSSGLVDVAATALELGWIEPSGRISQGRKSISSGKRREPYPSWDHVALDPEHKLVLAVVPGVRTEENAHAIVAEVGQRVSCDPPPMRTSDESPASATAIEEVFSVPLPAPPRRKPGRPRVVPERRLPEDVIDAMVHKHRQNGRVIAVEQRQLFGSPEARRRAGRVGGELLGEHLVGGA